jgi:hypothetical protein
MRRGSRTALGPKGLAACRPATTSSGLFHTPVHETPGALKDAPMGWSGTHPKRIAVPLACMPPWRPPDYAAGVPAAGVASPSGASVRR